MRLIVATLPDSSFSLGRDVPLTKLSVLYGDEVVLFSPTYHGVEPFFDFANREVLHQLLWLAILRRDPGFVIGEKLSPSQRETRIKAAADRSHALLQKALRWMELTSTAFPLSKDLARERDQIADEAKADARKVGAVFADDKDFVQRARQLSEAQRLGLVHIQQISKVPSLRYDQTKLVSDIAAALSTPDSYGALDERFIKPLKPLSRSQLEKQKTIQVAYDMFRRLPLFEKASFEEIRDIKKELARPLTNFRRGVSEISRQIRSQPWDRDFPHDVEGELTTRLLPEVAAIEDKVETNSYLKQLVHRLAKDPLILPSSSALGMILSTTLQTSAIASQVAGAIAGAGLLAYEAHKEWKDQKRSIEENLFFFYYRVAKGVAPGRSGNRRKKK
jgi:hypothetical protein